MPSGRCIHQVKGFSAGVCEVLYTPIQSVLKRSEQEPPLAFAVLLQPSA